MKELTNHLGTIDLSRYAWCLNVSWKSHNSNGSSKLGREYLIFTSQLLQDFSHQQGWLSVLSGRQPFDQSKKPKRLWKKQQRLLVSVWGTTCTYIQTLSNFINFIESETQKVVFSGVVPSICNFHFKWNWRLKSHSSQRHNSSWIRKPWS